MRPRNLLALVFYCKSNAVNLQHKKISEEDIFKAISAYSADLVNEISLEIRDVFPHVDDILYYFIGAPSILSLKHIKEILKECNLSPNELEKLIEILLWFGFLGVVKINGKNTEDIYIFKVFYDIKKLKRLSNNYKDENQKFKIHHSFWPFLEIETKR